MSAVRRRGSPNAVEQPVGGRAERSRESAPKVTPAATVTQFDLRDAPRGHLESGGEFAAAQVAGLAGEGQSVGGVVHEQDITNRKGKRQGSAVDSRIGANVRRLREVQGLKQADLARLVGCSAPRISQLEGGEPWSVDLALQFAAALGVGLMELVDAEPDPIQVLLMEAVRAKNYGLAARLALAAARGDKL